MDIEIAKESCKAYINAIDTFGTIDYECINNLYEPIKVVLSELEKKDKVINEMAKELSKLNYLQYCNANNCDYPPCNKERCIKQYFIKKVEDK